MKRRSLLAGAVLALSCMTAGTAQAATTTTVDPRVQLAQHGQEVLARTGGDLTRVPVADRQAVRQALTVESVTTTVRRVPTPAGLAYHECDTLRLEQTGKSLLHVDIWRVWTALTWCWDRKKVYWSKLTDLGGQVLKPGWEYEGVKGQGHFQPNPREVRFYAKHQLRLHTPWPVPDQVANPCHQLRGEQYDGWAWLYTCDLLAD